MKLDSETAAARARYDSERAAAFASAYRSA
jgi:hypothetical protein